MNGFELTQLVNKTVFELSKSPKNAKAILSNALNSTGLTSAQKLDLLKSIQASLLHPIFETFSVNDQTEVLDVLNDIMESIKNGD